MKDLKETRRQRAIDLRAFLARHSHLFSLKDVCAEASLNYNSTVNNIGRLIKKNEHHAMSDDRLKMLEEAAIKLSETNLQPTVD